MPYLPVIKDTPEFFELIKSHARIIVFLKDDVKEDAAVQILSYKRITKRISVQDCACDPCTRDVERLSESVEIITAKQR